MRTTVVLDDALIASARARMGSLSTSALVNAALRALVERESARRLARLSGTEPDLARAPETPADLSVIG
jgi:Arc/MetJ family transcription regulator